MIGKPTVLVVDDDPDKLNLLRFALTRAGYQVHTALDGQEGLEAVASFEPDLVVSDIVTCGQGDLATAVRAARLAIEDSRDRKSVV